MTLFLQITDICAISETWLDISINYCEFTPTGYKSLRCDNDSKILSVFYNFANMKRGGLLLMIMEELNPVEFPPCKVDADSTSIAVLVGVMCRPEQCHQHNLERIRQSINSIATENTILLG